MIKIFLACAAIIFLVVCATGLLSTEKALAVIGSLTLIVTSGAGLVAAVNYFIRESSLVANSISELKIYKFKRRKKDGSAPLIS